MGRGIGAAFLLPAAQGPPASFPPEWTEGHWELRVSADKWRDLSAAQLDLIARYVCQLSYWDGDDMVMWFLEKDGAAIRQAWHGDARDHATAGSALRLTACDRG